MVRAARELGKTLFESAEYAARKRSNHDYVYDLYQTYMLRSPASGGWIFWEGLVPAIGREIVRRAFDESSEFISKVATVTPNGSASGSASSLLSARVDPNNQVASSNIYEAADSSYLQLIDSGTSLLLRPTDGTQMSYTKLENEWRCTQIKDRNGNFITVNYNTLGDLTSVIDTLGRTITFNYDGNANLISITQIWHRDLQGGGQTTETHQWPRLAGARPRFSLVSRTLRLAVSPTGNPFRYSRWWGWMTAPTTNSPIPTGTQAKFRASRTMPR